MKRRDFLKKSALTLGAMAIGGKEVAAHGMQKGHAVPGMDSGSKL